MKITRLSAWIQFLLCCIVIPLCGCRMQRQVTTLQQPVPVLAMQSGKMQLGLETRDTILSDIPKNSLTGNGIASTIIYSNAVDHPGSALPNKRQFQEVKKIALNNAQAFTSAGVLSNRFPTATQTSIPRDRTGVTHKFIFWLGTVLAILLAAGAIAWSIYLAMQASFWLWGVLYVLGGVLVGTMLFTILYTLAVFAALAQL